MGIGGLLTTREAEWVAEADPALVGRRVVLSRTGSAADELGWPTSEAWDLLGT